MVSFPLSSHSVSCTQALCWGTAGARTDFINGWPANMAVISSSVPLCNTVPGSKYIAYCPTARPSNSDKSINSAKVSGRLSKTYTGSAITLTGEEVKKALKVSVTGKTLTYGKDYVITGYSNNVKKGTATAYISGIGDYSGMKLVKFKITAKTMILKNN